MGRYGDIDCSINRMRTAHSSIELHRTIYFPLRRECRIASAALYARVRTPCAHCTRDRGCSAHPAFPAPSDFRGRELLTNLGRIVPRERGSVSEWKWKAPSLRGALATTCPP